jgi:hypothetical protein
MLVEGPEALYRPTHRKRHRSLGRSRINMARISWPIAYAIGMPSPHSKDVLGRQAEEDLADRFVVQDSPLSLLRNRVDVA